MHLLRAIQKARSPLNPKNQPFFQSFFSSSFATQIGNWFRYSDVKKTDEHDVEDFIIIGSIEIEYLGVECHSVTLLAFFQFFCNKPIVDLLEPGKLT